MLKSRSKKTPIDRHFQKGGNNFRDTLGLNNTICSTKNKKAQQMPDFLSGADGS